MKISLKNIIHFLAYLVIFFLIWRDVSLLFQTRAAVGIDGYYYVLQINSYREFGYFYFSTNTPLVLYFLSFLSYLVSETVLAIKLGAIILQIFLCAGIAAFLQIIVKNTWLMTSGVFFAAFSTLHLYFLSEFLSNLGALTFLIWGAFGVIKTFQTKRKAWFVVTLSMLLAASLCHRSAIWLIVWIFFVVLLAYLVLNRATLIKQKITLSLVTVFLFFFPVVLTWQSVFALPESVLSELSQYPQNPFHSLILMESLMLSVVSITTISIFFLKPEILQNNLSGLVLFSIALWSWLITLNPFLNHQEGILGITARLDSLAYLQAAIGIPLWLDLAISYSKKLAVVIALLILPLFFLHSAAPFPAGLKSEYLRTREKLIGELPSMRSQICEQPFIVARHGEQFLVTVILKIPSQQKLPVEKQFQCVFWLIHQREAGYQIIFENSVTSSDGEFSLVEDTEIRKNFETIPDEERRRLLLENPHLGFLSK